MQSAPTDIIDIIIEIINNIKNYHEFLLQFLNNNKSYIVNNESKKKSHIAGDKNITPIYSDYTNMVLFFNTDEIIKEYIP